jgi:hypothetical protein
LDAKKIKKCNQRRPHLRRQSCKFTHSRQRLRLCPYSQSPSSITRKRQNISLFFDI